MVSTTSMHKALFTLCGEMEYSDRAAQSCKAGWAQQGKQEEMHQQGKPKEMHPAQLFHIWLHRSPKMGTLPPFLSSGSQSRAGGCGVGEGLGWIW